MFTDVTWSPDGKRIAFSVGLHPAWIATAKPDGTDVRWVTKETNASDLAPDWSPDGTRIAFTRESAIYVVKTDGSQLTKLTNGPGDSDPAWSPDSSRIVYSHFVSITSSSLRVVGVPPRASGTVELATGVAQAEEPDWQRIIDTVPPRGSCQRPTTLWYPADRSFTCGASDSGSGLLHFIDGKFILRTHVPTGTETAFAKTDWRKVCDVVGNCMKVGPVAPVRIDKKGPSITITSPANGGRYKPVQNTGPKPTSSV
jgi:dipeptidyl aminopeptidase/acylaminoacyl peptidase